MGPITSHAIGIRNFWTGSLVDLKGFKLHSSDQLLENDQILLGEQVLDANSWASDGEEDEDEEGEAEDDLLFDCNCEEEDGHDEVDGAAPPCISSLREQLISEKLHRLQPHFPGAVFLTAVTRAVLVRAAVQDVRQVYLAEPVAMAGSKKGTGKLPDAFPLISHSLPPSLERVSPLMNGLCDDEIVLDAGEGEVVQEATEKSLPEAKNDNLFNLEIVDQDHCDLLNATATKKAVRFADDTGRSLTEVRIFEQAPEIHFSDFSPMTARARAKWNSNHMLPPPVPRMASVFDQVSPIMLPLAKRESTIARPSMQLTFVQPASQYLSFRTRLDEGNVALENVNLSVDADLRLSGTIKVKNLAFEKSVWLRVTVDDWASYTDYHATYDPVRSDLDTRYDNFSFNALVPIGRIECQRVVFAVGYAAGEQASVGEYWDNNDGSNYVIRRSMEPSSATATDDLYRDGPQDSVTWLHTSLPQQFHHYCWDTFNHESVYY